MWSELYSKPTAWKPLVMLSIIEELLVIQDRDQKILRLEKELERIPLEEEKSRSRLAADEASVKEAKERIQAEELAIKNVELDVETRRETVVRLKTQQFQTKKNEEFRALGNEVVRYNEEVEALEDKQLEHMETLDSLKGELKTAGEALDRTQALVDEELAGLASRREEVKKRLDEMVGERQKLAANVDEDTLDLYERLMKTKNGLAVVGIENGICSGCHMKLTPDTIHKANAAREIVHCEQCSRMLFIAT
ncbi:MAG: C4-type zinc ribbon domain-containing protein [Verrucomicrobiota bacterium]